MVAQLPVFFALFGVLRAIAEDQPKYGLTPAVVASAQHAKIFGVVTVADRLLTTLLPPTFSSIGAGSQEIVILLTVIVSATTTFMTVRQSMKRGMTPQVDPSNPMASSQKMMQYIVPVFALSGLYWQYGLVLYWVTTNLWTLGQQYVLFKRFPLPVLATAGAGGTPSTTGGKTGTRPLSQGSPGQAGRKRDRRGPGRCPAAGCRQAGGRPVGEGRRVPARSGQWGQAGRSPVQPAADQPAAQVTRQDSARQGSARQAGPG